MKKILTLLSLFVSLTINAEIITSTIGDSITWTINDDGLLVISGKGSISGYYNDQNATVSIFKPYNTLIKNIIVEEGITSLGDGAFVSMGNLETVKLPERMTSIGKDAFYYCKKMTHINIPNDLTYIGERAFQGCI